MRANYHDWAMKEDLVEQNVHGPGAGVGDWKREMIVDLSKIHYEVTSEQKD